MDIETALEIVLDLAEQNVLDARQCGNEEELLDQRALQLEACKLVRRNLAKLKV